ncbi:WD40 repeat-like protein [Phellopilus nigrolimitatus]|nr:WD40 repeat-like protein [Phellopilus nigrolimitatus]
MNHSSDSSPLSVSTDYISASANRHSCASDSSGSLVAFGSSKFVALWSASEDQNSGIHQTLPGHDGLVTCVRFKLGEGCFLSADDKGYLRCWRLENNKWVSTGVLHAHKKAISALCVFGDCVATGSSDATITVWRHIPSTENMKDELQEVQRIDLKGRYPLDIQIATLPESDNVIMAVSATERNISIFTRSEEQFVRAASLPGHEDWIKSLAFQQGVAGPAVLTLASGSRDGTIRLWNIEKLVKEKKESSDQIADPLSDDLLDSFEAALGDIAEGEEGGRQISMKRHVMTIRNKSGSLLQYSITFDALLIGHEAGITSLTWRPSPLECTPCPMLLSTSTDSSLILWAPSSITASAGGESTSLWINQQRFGDIGGQRLGGFVGAVWTRDGADVLAWGWNGGWRRWSSQADSDSNAELWKEVSAISGHRGSVRGISWSPGGEYLISTGPDQTTRIHGSVNARSPNAPESWHEICRPQVHGYDLIDAVFLGPTRFTSIADEKVARVFEAPQSFVSLCQNLSILPDIEDKSKRPMAASVPPLGLSNKALSGVDSTEPHFPLPSASMTQRRPFEGELAVSTLWPEAEKVFGHGYELHAIAVSHSGKYVATSCRASSPEHAGIKVYDTRTWQPYGQTLQGHQLTVTRIAFSRDDRYILSVSRDRTWIIYQAEDDGYVAITADKSHTRIVWDCAWAHENDVFATASRDRTVKIWNLRDLTAKKKTPLVTIKTKEAATAVAFSPASGSRRRLLAVGMENGNILIYSSSIDMPEKWIDQIYLDKSIAHVDQIHRIDWRPQKPNLENTKDSQLATCSEDGTLRILHVRL